MADSSVVSAFRQRASRLGYRNIVIKKCKNVYKLYHICLVEPLASIFIDFYAFEYELKTMLSQRAEKQKNDFEKKGV